MSGRRTVRSLSSCSFMFFLSAAMQRSADPLIAFDLTAMHDASRLGVERVAPMQHGEIVPHQKVADLPFMAHGEARLRRVCPERVEQGFAIRYVEPHHIGIRAAAEEQRLRPLVGSVRTSG